MLKKRTPEQIRLDALKMGVKKAQSGCPACAEKYFELAQQHGTTEQEIQEALEQATGMGGKRLSRRELMRYAVASGLALTASGLMSLETHNTAEATSYYFGIDSNTTICCSMPLNFYVGRMGYGVYPDKSYYAFNTAMANKVGYSNTFGYWGVQGPNVNTGGRTPYNWGKAQADAAWAAWDGTFIGANYVGGFTVFGDVETGFGGWGTNTVANNQAVISGFVFELFAITPASVWPGLYVSPYFWNTWLGGNGFNPGGYVLWINGWYECDVCGPCNLNCSTTVQDAERLYSNNVKPKVVGGQHPVLWQYWLTNPGCDNSGCGDWDISDQLTPKLQPAF